MTEKNYDFRKRLLNVHQADRRDRSVSPLPDEVLIDDGWVIAVEDKSDRVLLNTAKDFQDYFLTSMNVGLAIKTEQPETGRYILLTTQERQGGADIPDGVPRSYRIISDDNRVVVSGYDSAGTAQGSYYLEDIMNLRGAPVIKKDDVTRKPLFSPRMVHSGYGLDMYPDEYLCNIAHSGMDTILVFAKDTDTTPHGYLDFNDLVYRAGGYGIDVYAYSYIKSGMHPEDTGAEEYYDKNYGRLFKRCPGLKGVVLVGESVEFPSRDVRTTGRPYYEVSEDGLPKGKPSPGWWPCDDYPQWLEMIKKVVRRYNRNADIVFWTYNWGYAEEKYRLELIRNIPDDISLLVTFEMFQNIKRDDINTRCVDYTLSFEGPGDYFKSEAQVAHERNIKLYAMSNTGGLSWDFGVIPYEPAPNQWIRRYEALHSAREQWGLHGLMESHHYGWWPSFVSEIAKWSYWDPSPSHDEVCGMIAARDYGEENTENVLSAWNYLSEGIRHYISTNQDQYGPFRIGPSFPLKFIDSLSIPSVPHAMFGGNTICNFSYCDDGDHSLASLMQFRWPVEIKYLGEMEKQFSLAEELLGKVYKNLPEPKKKNAFYLLNLIRFMINCVRTTKNVKKWFSLRTKLLTETDEKELNRIVDEMMEIAEDEMNNAENTIPLVEADSRLGWEPSMEYMTDTYHLQWKIKQVKGLLERDLPAYRDMLYQHFHSYYFGN